MKEIIPKVATNRSNLKRAMHYFVNARTAWEDILIHYSREYSNLRVMLPAYIGYSEREGSGIFDPVNNHKIEYEFYALDKHLQIDFEDFKRKISEGKDKKLVLLVHYFGFVDVQYTELCEWLDSHNILYVEDCAHSMITDLIGGYCGRKGNHSFYSIHKLLPFEEGGVLVNNKITNNFQPQFSKKFVNDIFQFDLKGIFDKRRENYLLMVDLLRKMNSVKILKEVLLPGECPQSLPLIVLTADRDAIYFEMNRKGYGLVSLYHTMIEALRKTKYASSTYTSKKIINLPVHQDVEKNDIVKMINAFKAVIQKN